MANFKEKVNIFLMTNLYSITFLKKIAYMLNNRRDYYLKRYAHIATEHDKKMMIRALIKYGTSYEEYFLFDCRTKDASDYITEANRWKYYKRLNGKNGLNLFKSKIKSYEIFKDLYGRECAEIRDKQSFDVFVERHPKFVYKVMDGCMGKGVTLIDASNDKDAVWDDLCKKVPFIAEEPIKQGEGMSALHPDSVNTIRIPTILTGSTRDTYEVHFFAPFVKCGQNGSFVDNGGSGGIVSRVSADGTIITDGVDEMCNIYKEHPNTKIVFNGYKIPEYDKALELVREAAMRTKDVRYVGWDVAYSDKGWVIVEGNSCGQLLGQICDKKGEKSELDALMKKI